MDKAGSRRIRFLFRTGDFDRHFCWFEQRGDDLYWGPSRGGVTKGAATQSDGFGLTISVPDEIEIVDSGSVKASFHDSGQFHLKQAGGMVNPPQRWRMKKDIEAPYRIAAVFSKHPVLYEPYPSQRLLTRSRTNAQIISVDQEGEATRHYFEFFLSPEGRFSLPPPLFSMNSSSNTEPEPMFFSLNEQLILVTRLLIISPRSEFSAWHPELELWVYGDDGANAATDAV